VTSNPGGRWGAGYWVCPNTTDDPTHSYEQLFMFGGDGWDSTGNNGNNLMNDLWRYLPYPD
jgi:hypothetical protein